MDLRRRAVPLDETMYRAIEYLLMHRSANGRCRTRLLRSADYSLVENKTKIFQKFFKNPLEIPKLFYSL